MHLAPGTHCVDETSENKSKGKGKGKEAKNPSALPYFTPRGSARRRQRTRFDDPVSRTTLNVCPGVPSWISAKYSRVREGGSCFSIAPTLYQRD